MLRNTLRLTIAATLVLASTNPAKADPARVFIKYQVFESQALAIPSATVRAGFPTKQLDQMVMRLPPGTETPVTHALMKRLTPPIILGLAITALTGLAFALFHYLHSWPSPVDFGDGAAVLPMPRSQALASFALLNFRLPPSWESHFFRFPLEEKAA